MRLMGRGNGTAGGLRLEGHPVAPSSEASSEENEIFVSSTPASSPPEENARCCVEGQRLGQCGFAVSATALTSTKTFQCAVREG